MIEKIEPEIENKVVIFSVENSWIIWERALKLFPDDFMSERQHSMIQLRDFLCK